MWKSFGKTNNIHIRAIKVYVLVSCRIVHVHIYVSPLRQRDLGRGSLHYLVAA